MTKIQKRRNDCMRLLSKNYRVTLYDPRINIHNSIQHEMAKCKLIYELKKEGKEVYAEAIFKNGKRADLLVADDFLVIEILHSEQLSDAQEKTKDYPPELHITYRQSEEILNTSQRL